MTAFDSAIALARKLETREVSALELLDECLARIDRLDADTNAICWLDAQRARAQAASITEPPDERRPLLGIPMTVKEAFDLAGSPTTWGVPAFAENISSSDSVVVERLKAAGAVVFGKTNVSVMLGDIQSYNSIYGTTNNPWNPAHTPGGSSGGSGAALAAGLSVLEMGSDIGGSIRTPAHYCGVFGHKPTWGLVPSRGHGLPYMVSEPDIAVVGPMARSAFDLEAMLRLLARPDELAGAVRYELPALAGRGLGDLRVAVWSDDEVAPVSREIAGRVELVAQVLRDAGARVDYEARPVSSAHSHDVYHRLLFAFIGAGEGTDEQYEERRRKAASLAAEDDSEKALELRCLDHGPPDLWLGLNSARDIDCAGPGSRSLEDYDIVLVHRRPPRRPWSTTTVPFGERTIEVDDRARSDFSQPYVAADILGGTARHLTSAVHGDPDRSRRRRAADRGSDHRARVRRPGDHPERAASRTVHHHQRGARGVERIEHLGKRVVFAHVAGEDLGAAHEAAGVEHARASPFRRRRPTRPGRAPSTCH